MDRIRTLVRRNARAWFIEATVLVVAMVIGGTASDATEIATTGYSETNDLIGLAAIAALLWRRRWPVHVALLTFVASAAAPFAGGAAIVALFWVAAHCSTRVAGWMAALSIAPTAVAIALFPDKGLTWAQSALAGAVILMAALGWGLVVRSRQQLLESYAERAQRAETDQQARLDEVRRAERERIAWEMHDVLAHRLSLLSLHAGALEFRPDAPPADLARAAGIVRSNAHLALEELRGVIDVLRAGSDTGSETGSNSGSDHGPGPVAPQPTFASLPPLIEESRRAGMHVTVADTVGEAEAVPADIGRHAYRVVQEALTNARKHAPGSAVRVSVRGGPGAGLTIEVCTDAHAGSEPSAIPGSGVGLVGLAERLEVAGGSLEHGHTPGGGHLLRAWLPWPS